MTLAGTMLAACAHGTSSAAASNPTPQATSAARAATARPVAVKRLAVRPVVHATPSPAPTSRAMPSVRAETDHRKPTLSSVNHAKLANPAISATPAGPKILSVATMPTVVHTGETVTWNVRTSPDVVSVTAHVSAYTFPLQRRGPGWFFLGFTIPSNVPPIFHGTYNLEMTARAERGSSATRIVPMIFQ